MSDRAFSFSGTGYKSNLGKVKNYEKFVDGIYYNHAPNPK